MTTPPIELIKEFDANVPCPECDWLVTYMVQTPIGIMCSDCAEDYEERKLFSYDNNES